MKYEYAEGTYVGIAIVVEDTLTRCLEDQLAQVTPFYVSRYLETRLSTYEHEFVKSMQENGRCSYFDFFLLYSNSQEANGGTPAFLSPLLLIGVHDAKCAYELKDFLEIANRVGFVEKDHLSEKILRSYLADAVEPYIAPCIYAKQSLNDKGYTVVQP